MNRRHVMIAAIASVAATSAFAQSGDMNEADRQHIANTLRIGSMSLEISRLAVARASEAKVREFANFEVAEQETVGGILKAFLEGPAPVDPMQAETVKKLESAGSQFDREFVQAETEGHEKLLQIQENYIAAGKNRAQVDIAKLVRGMIKEHLTLLADLQKGEMKG